MSAWSAWWATISATTNSSASTTRASTQTDLERVPGAQSFFWEGRYDDDMQVATTIDTQLNVFADFDPKLSDGSREASTVFLANIQPNLQRAVRAQCGSALITGLDSMNYWIESARESLLETLAVVDVVIDVEVRMLTGEPNLKAAAAKMRAHGTRVLIIKQGGSGACMCSDEGFFFVPGMPLDTVAIDPTGAGDAFAGGFFGYLDSHASDPFDGASLRRAAVYGSVMASFAIEDFGSDCLERVTHAQVVERGREFRLTAFDHRRARASADGLGGNVVVEQTARRGRPATATSSRCSVPSSA